MNARPNLPDWHQVSEAFRGQATETGDAHLVRLCAAWLANLHRTRRAQPDRAAEVDSRRAQIVALIDQWISTHVPIPAKPARRPASAPRPKTEPVGTALDQMAEAYIAAESLLLTGQEQPEAVVHEAWSEVGFQATRWADLVAWVIDGQPPLPDTVSVRPVGPHSNSLSQLRGIRYE